MHHNVRPQLQRPLQIRRAIGVIHQQQRPLTVGNLGHCGNIDQAHIRVSRRFAIHQPGTRAYRRRQPLRPGQVNVGDFHAVARQPMMKIAEGAAINGFIDDQLIPWTE
ncbi:hypothetical protein D3C78_1172300 [compost metagenome]